MGKDNCSRKSREDGSPKCVNCNGDHAANFKDCPTRQKYLEKIVKMRNNRSAAAYNSSANSIQHQQHNLILKKSDFPPLQTKQVNQEDTEILNFTSPQNSNQTYADISMRSNNLQARLDKIKNYSKVEAKFEALIQALEACNGDEDKMFEVMVRFRSSRIPKPSLSLSDTNHG